jgi:hypothetical protein
MGQSTNGVLFYGYCWEDQQEFDTDMDLVVKAILKSRGRTDPWDEHYNGDYQAYRRWADGEGREEVSAWYDAAKQVKQELGVDWDTHCSGDYPIPYLYAVGSEKTAHRGDREPVTSLDVDPAWREKLAAFLSSQGIGAPDGDNQPGWWLVSYWG